MHMYICIYVYVELLNTTLSLIRHDMGYAFFI